jgi:hypothetical protein
MTTLRELTEEEIALLDQVITENTPGRIWTCEMQSPYTVVFSTVDQQLELVFTGTDQTYPLSNFQGEGIGSIYLPNPSKGNALTLAMMTSQTYFEAMFQAVRNHLEFCVVV